MAVTCFGALSAIRSRSGAGLFTGMPLSYRMLHGDKGVVEWAKKWGADAIVAQLGDVDIKLLRDLKIPIIVQNYQDRISGVCNLTGDYIGTGRIAADFFLRKGYYNFAYYGITDTVWGAGARRRVPARTGAARLQGLSVPRKFADARGVEL